jgi:hypothetical protein
MSGWIIPAIASGIAALGAIIAAGIAAHSAINTKRHETNAARLIELERRMVASRVSSYESFFDAVDKVWTAARQGTAVPEDVSSALLGFMHWVQLYGSDRSVTLAHRYMQATFSDAPFGILIRLLGELFLEARRELGHPKTDVTVIDLLGVRINDVYAQAQLDALSLPLREVYARHHWTPPWEVAAGGGVALSAQQE